MIESARKALAGRLNLAITKLGVSTEVAVEILADITGMSAETVVSWLNGLSAPHKTLFPVMAMGLKVNIIWLQTGGSSMCVASSPGPDNYPFALKRRSYPKVGK